MLALNLLTVRDGQAYGLQRHRYIAIVGFGDPMLEAHKSRVTPAVFLCSKNGSPYNGRAVWETEMSAGPLAGSPTCTVPLTRLATGKRSSNTALEDSIMANTATSTGEIRPTSEILQGVLVELDAWDALVEQLLVHGPDSAVLDAIRTSLADMFDILSGGHHA